MKIDEPFVYACLNKVWNSIAIMKPIKYCYAIFTMIMILVLLNITFYCSMYVYTLDLLSISSVKMRYGNQMMMIRSECRQVKWCKRQIVLVFLFVYEFKMMMRNLQKTYIWWYTFSPLSYRMFNLNHICNSPSKNTLWNTVS